MWMGTSMLLSCEMATHLIGTAEDDIVVCNRTCASLVIGVIVLSTSSYSWCVSPTRGSGTLLVQKLSVNTKSISRVLCRRLVSNHGPILLGSERDFYLIPGLGLL